MDVPRIWESVKENCGEQSKASEKKDYSVREKKAFWPTTCGFDEANFKNNCRTLRICHWEICY